MKQYIKQKTLGAGLILATLGLLFNAQVVSADVLDSPTISSLTIHTEEKVAAKAAAEAQAQEDLATNMISEVAIEYTSNTYPWGQCTWGAKEMAPWIGNYWGNAGEWADSALARGFEVGTTPKVGAVIVWTSSYGYGHVGFVTEVGENGQIQIMESNVNGSMAVANYRGWFDPTTTSEGTVSYIYPPAEVVTQ